jgi:hypothetical protein
MLKRIVAIFLAAIIMSSQFVSVARADDSYDESFYSSNDILFFDPRCDTGVAEGLISLTGKDNLEKILKFFIYGEPKPPISGKLRTYVRKVRIETPATRKSIALQFIC